MEIHFNRETLIRREIIHLEKMIDGCTGEMSRSKLEIYKLNQEKNPTVKVGDLEAKIKKTMGEKESHQQLLNAKYQEQTNLVNQRKVIQAVMSSLAKEVGATSLTFTYKYYLANLDKMALDHRKEANLIAFETRKNDLIKLEDQVKKRDKLIFDLKNRLTANGENFELNDFIVSLNMIEKNPNNTLPAVVNRTGQRSVTGNGQAKRNLPYFQRRNSKAIVTS